MKNKSLLKQEGLKELQKAEEEIKHKKNKSELVLWVQLIAVIILIRILSRYVVIGFGAMAFISILIATLHIIIHQELANHHLLQLQELY